MIIVRSYERDGEGHRVISVSLFSVTLVKYSYHSFIHSFRVRIINDDDYDIDDDDYS
jgi:hypothetical protein